MAERRLKHSVSYVFELIRRCLRDQPRCFAIAYLVLGLFWIYGTDYLMANFADSLLWINVSLYKGIFFIVATALLFRYVMNSRLKAMQQAIASHYEYVIKYANDVFILAEVDAPCGIVEVNERACSTYGYQREEMIGMPVALLRAPEMRTGSDRDISQYFDEQPARVYETLHQRKDGTTFPVDVSGRRVTIGDRRFLQAVIRDISEAKRHETILAVSRERLRRLIDSLPDPAWMKDKTGHYIAANQALADYLGVRVNALIGKSSADFFAPELAAAFAQNERNVIETGIQSRSVRSFETVRGERWYDTVVVAIAEDGADDYGTAGITRDVTELRSAARETQRHAEEMSTLMEDIPDPIVRIDHGYRFIYANRAAQVFAADYGLEVSDRPVRSSGIPAEGVDSLERHLAAAFESRQQQRFELGILSTDGSVMLEILLQPEIDALGGVISVLAIGRDISQRKKLEQERGRHEQQLRDMLVQTIHSMALTVEKRDPYTAGHQGRVADLAVAIGHELGLSEHSIQGLRLGSMIHDIGKIYIPAEILNRPGRLTPQEMALIRTHPEVGYDIVKDIDFIWPVKEVILQHHERPDGSGYPGGLKGDEIALEARIVAAADVMEAISSHRPYRPALGVERGLEEIRKGRGARYDPDVVDACLGLFAEKRFAFRAE